MGKKTKTDGKCSKCDDKIKVTALKCLFKETDKTLRLVRESSTHNGRNSAEDVKDVVEQTYKVAKKILFSETAKKTFEFDPTFGNGWKDSNLIQNVQKQIIRKENEKI